MRNRLVQFIILSVMLAVGAYVIVSSLINKEVVVKVGEKAPDFTLYDLQGRKFNLQDYKGKPIVINFWGTFCPPCVREMPALQRQYEQWKNQGVQFVGINLNESKITIEAFLKQHNISFTILMDDDTIRKKYNVNSYPTTFYVNPEGIIKDIFIGEMQENDIMVRVGGILK